MARSSFPVEVLTPEGQVWEGEVEMISTRTATGSIGVLAHHAPLMAMLEPCELKLYTSGSESPDSGQAERFAQGEGYLQVAGEYVLLLVDEVFERDELNPSDLQERLRKAEEQLSGAEEDSEEQRAAQREKRRYEAFLKIAEGPGS